jgi:WD40 repeat protein
MQRKWRNRGARIGFHSSTDRGGPYYFESIDDKIHLMHQTHPEQDPVSVLSGIEEGLLVIDGDTVHVVGRVWQQGNLSRGQWSLLGDTPWQLWDDFRTLPQRRFSLFALSRSNHYGLVANYHTNIDRRLRRKLVQVVFDGSGFPLIELSPPDDGRAPAAASRNEPRSTTSLPEPEYLWPQDIGEATERRLPGITDLAYSPDGKWIATAQIFEKDCVRLWDGNGRIVAGLLDRPRGMRRVAFSSSGKYLAAMDRDGTVVVWSTESRQLHRRFQAESADWCQVAISWNDRYVIGAPYLAKGCVWDLHSGEKLCTLSCLRDPNGWMRFSPDSTRVLADAGEVNTPGLRSWDLTSGRMLSRASTPGRVAGFLPDGTLLALSESPAGTDALIAWDDGNNTYRKLWDHAYGWPVAVSADGRRVAFVYDAGTAVWDLATQKRLATHGERMSGRWAFSPDGKWLASGNGSLVRVAVPE